MTQMRNLKIIGVAMLAVCAVSIVVAAPASASVFLASAAGLLILDNGIGIQKFKTDGGVVECTKATSHGKTTATSASFQIDIVLYTGCKAFGSGVTVSPAEYQFNANNTTSVLNTIIVTSATGNCTVKVSSVGNQNLSKVSYETDKSNLGAMIIKAEVAGISYLSSGSICGPTGELKDGTYIGEALVFAHGGTLSWDA